MVARKKPAALLAAAAATVGVVVLPAAAGLRTAEANVTLQVVPRGPGKVTSGANECTRNVEGEGAACSWSYPSGTTVVLTATPDAGETFSRWSTSECPGTGTCQLTLDADTSIVALFGRLTLRVQTSGDQEGDFITIDPGGLRCPPTCSPRFATGTVVTLTVTTKAPSTFTSFPYGCESVSGSTCRLTLLDNGQQVGAKFNNQPGPVADAVVKVTVKVKKDGDGDGLVTATGLSCGDTCSASFPYGTLVPFQASAVGASLFRGWGGICANDADTRCTLPIGPITLLRPRFVRDAAPSAPGTPAVASRTATSVSLTWTAATDDVGVKQYDVLVSGGAAPAVSTASTSATVTGLACGKTYAVEVRATDTAGHQSPPATAQVQTAPCVLRVTLVRGGVTGRQLVCRYRVNVRATGSAALVVAGKVAARKRVTARAGMNAVAFRLPPAAHGRRVGVVMRLAASGGPPRTSSWSFQVRR
jgi:Divergent InlB B-repeat domain/Fibronectin type III domain